MLSQSFQDLRWQSNILLMPDRDLGGASVSVPLQDLLDATALKAPQQSVRYYEHGRSLVVIRGNSQSIVREASACLPSVSPSPVEITQLSEVQRLQTSYTRYELFGGAAGLFLLGAGGSHMPYSAGFFKGEELLSRMETTLTGTHYLNLERDGAGKFCLCYDAKTNMLHLYGEINSKNLARLSTDYYDGSNHQLVLNDLARARVSSYLHKNLPRPHELNEQCDGRFGSQVKIVGGGSVLLWKGTLFFASSSVDFGPVTSAAVRKCLEGADIPSHTQLGLEGDPEACTIFFMRSGRRFAKEAISATLSQKA
jgi:hypothetical protein